MSRERGTTTRWTDAGRSRGRAERPRCRGAWTGRSRGSGTSTETATTTCCCGTLRGVGLYYAADGRHRIAAGRGLALPRDLRLRFAGIGDLNGDGTDDVLLRHEDGRWFYHALRRGRSVAAQSGWTALGDDAGFRLGGVGDLNGDGNDDVLLRGSGGQWYYYAMDGREIAEETSGRAEISSGETWRLAGIGDFDGDGRDDVLLQNADGAWYYYAMDGRRSVASRSGELALPETGSAHACGDPGLASYVGRVTGFSGARDDLEVVLTGRGSLHSARPGGRRLLHISRRGARSLRGQGQRPWPQDDRVAHREIPFPRGARPLGVRSGVAADGPVRIPLGGGPGHARRRGVLVACRDTSAGGVPRRDGGRG